MVTMNYMYIIMTYVNMFMNHKQSFKLYMLMPDQSLHIFFYPIRFNHNFVFMCHDVCDKWWEIPSWPFHWCIFFSSFAFKSYANFVIINLLAFLSFWPELKILIFPVTNPNLCVTKILKNHFLLCVASMHVGQYRVDAGVAKWSGGGGQNMQQGLNHVDCSMPGGLVGWCACSHSVNVESDSPE